MPDCPPELEYIWNWFCQLSSERDRGEMVGGVSPLKSTAIVNWGMLEGVRLTAFELRAIRGLDQTYLSPPPRAEEDEDDGDY